MEKITDFISYLFIVILFIILLWTLFAMGSIYEQDIRCKNGYTEVCYIKK